MKSGNHDCAVPGCQAGAKPGQLMCLPHWHSTPKILQRDVNFTWREYRRDKTTMGPLLAYRKARDAAIAHHTEKQAASAQPELF
jgi:hypothetical protein